MSDTEQDARQAIRARAYALWHDAGSPEGRADEFWQRAEAEDAAGEAALDETINESFPASDATNRG